MSVQAIRVSILRSEHVRQCAREVAERAQALADGLPPAQLKRIVAPLEATINESFRRAETQAVALVAAQTEAVDDLSVSALGLRAALREPARVAALLAVVAGASPPDLRRMAGYAGKENDAFAAAAITRRLGAGTAIEPGDLEAITSALSRIGASERAEAIADLVGAQSELSRLRAQGAYGDGSGVNGATMLEAASEVGRVPDGGGGFRQLTSAEISRACDASGVPRTGNSG